MKNGSIPNRFVTFQFSNYFPLPWAARQEKITSTITTVDGVKNPLRLVVSPIYNGFIYIYIYTSHVVATATINVRMGSRKQQRESRRRSESLGRNRNLSCELGFQMPPCSAFCSKFSKTDSGIFLTKKKWQVTQWRSWSPKIGFFSVTSRREVTTKKQPLNFFQPWMAVFSWFKNRCSSLFGGG